MGMTLAHRLAQQGHTVTVYESAPELGGLVSSWKMGEVEWDKFYHVILLSDFRTRNILKEIGLEDTIEWVETKTGFYMKGTLYSMSFSLSTSGFESPLHNFAETDEGSVTITSSNSSVKSLVNEICGLPVTDVFISLAV